MPILLGLVPAFMWGIQPVVLTKIGGKSTNQQMGMAMGAFLFSLFVVLFHAPSAWTLRLIGASMLSGLFWSFGQINQIKAYHLLGVAKANPISTGTQLIGTSFFGVLYFHEWTKTIQLILGFSAIILIILGVALTAYQEKDNAESVDMKKGFLVLIMSSIGFVGYIVIPQMASLDGWELVFPQSVAMFLGSIFVCSLEKQPEIWGKKSFQNILTGLVWATANITIMLSNQINGVAVGFTLSQMNVVIATLGGLLLLKEKKTKKELCFILTGLLFVIIGGILIGITKSY